MKKEKSAGAVIIREINGETEILLIETKDNTVGFPKGHLETNESEKEAAKREVIEETGYTNVVIGEKLGVIKRNSLSSGGVHVIKDIAMFRATVDGIIEKKAEWETKWVKLSEISGNFWHEEDEKFFCKIKDSL